MKIIVILSVLAMLVLVIHAAVKQEIGCEHGKEAAKIIMNCPAGEKVQVLTAFFGRTDTSICPGNDLTGVTTCHDDSALSTVRRKCQNKQACTVVAKTGVFNDYCPGTGKYLSVRYMCVSVKQEIGCEHGGEAAKITMECSAGKKIRVLTAFFGRTDKSICPGNDLTGVTSCYDGTALQKVRARCQNKRTCTVVAANGVFNDPCPRTGKYLSVRYQCE